MATANISTKNLKLGHVNIRSLLPSLDSVSDSVHRLELDILGVTETWLSERISGNSIEIDGYNTISINDFLTSFSLKQLTAEPTRIVNNQNSLIDYIITSNDRLIVGKVLHHDMHEETDHQLTFCTLNCIAPREAPKIIKYRNFKYFDSEMFHADLINTHWYDVLEEPNVENKVMLLTDKVRQLFDRHAPLCTVRITKQKAPWFTDVLRIMKKERNKLMSKYKKNKKGM